MYGACTGHARVYKGTRGARKRGRTGGRSCVRRGAETRRRETGRWTDRNENLIIIIIIIMIVIIMIVIKMLAIIR